MKVLIGAVIAVVVIVAVVAINKASHKANGEQSVSKVTTTGNKSQTIRLSDALKSKQTSIWYDFNLSSGEMLKRDTHVREVYVVKNGYITTYSTDFKVGELNKMSVSEVIAKAKKQDKEQLTSQINSVKKNIQASENEFSRYASSEQKASALASLNAISYEAPNPQKIKVTATNNGQNNTPTKESFSYKVNLLFTDGNEANSAGGKLHSSDLQLMSDKYALDTESYTIDVSGQSQYNSEIDGQKYNGFANELMTKVKSANIIFALDTDKGSLITKNTGSGE